MLKFAFLRQHRLTDQQHIRQVFRKGKKINAQVAAVFFYPNQLLYPRLCISISKKQVRRAWQRNLIKRIMRESFRLQQHVLPKLDIVVVAWKPITLLDSKQIRQVIDAQWQKLISSVKPA